MSSRLHSKASRCKASKSANIANMRFWIGFKEFWVTWTLHRFCQKPGNSKPCCISNKPLFPDLFSAFETTMGQWAQHNHESHSTVSDLTCTDCGKLFKSKRSLFGHRKEKHSGVVEVHTCPECGKTFGRKSNLKAHRESVHYGKKWNNWDNNQTCVCGWDFCIILHLDTSEHGW